MATFIYAHVCMHELWLYMYLYVTICMRMLNISYQKPDDSFTNIIVINTMYYPMPHTTALSTICQHIVKMDCFFVLWKEFSHFIYFSVQNNLKFLPIFAKNNKNNNNNNMANTMEQQKFKHFNIGVANARTEYIWYINWYSKMYRRRRCRRWVCEYKTMEKGFSG